MNRTEIIQQIIDRKQARNYLEIGVANGGNFYPMRVRRKVAVDPSFVVSPRFKIKWTIRNPCNLFAKFHETTSDRFFAEHDASRRFDVVFIDGLHTYGQAFTDVENSLKVLCDGGVILMHDCNPKSAAEAHPAESFEHAGTLNLPGWTGEWCGDTWKAVCALRRRDDLRVFVVDCDFGVGVVTRGKADDVLKLSDGDLEGMTYADLEKDRTGLLILKHASYFSEFLKAC